MSSLLLSSDPEITSKLQRYYRAILVIVSVVAVLIISCFGLLIRQSFINQDQRESLQETANRVEDCTNPDGQCFQEGQRRTADVVANLNVVTQYSVICGERVDGEAAILRCVNREVKDFLKVQSKTGSN